MFSFTHFNPSFHLQKAETVRSSSTTEFVFFDQKFDFVPGGAQILLGIFLDPSGEGHLEQLEGVSVQIDVDSGVVLDTLRKGEPSGKLDQPLTGCTDVQIGLQVERHGDVLIPRLSTSDGRAGVSRGSSSVSEADHGLVLPAFQAAPDCQLSGFCGYYSESLYHPEFGETQMCVWPDDVSI